MPVNFAPAGVEYIRFLPEIVLIAAGTLLMVLDVILRKQSRDIYGHISILALVAAMAAAVFAYSSPGPAFSDMLVVDGFATFFRVLVIGVGILTVLSSYRFLQREGAETGEYHALLLFSIAGQCVMVSANELIMIFIGLEISSISSYVLAGYLRDDKRANEAALKYFLLGSFATAFFLYGVAVVYGMTGSTYLTPSARRSRRTHGARPRIHRRGAGVDVRGAGLQGFRRAFPDLGAGCLPGRAHAGLRVPDDGPESRGLRHFPAHLHDRLRAHRARLVSAGVGIGAAVDDHRQLRRAHAIERQAAAGL
jgi:hypothetical protein